MNTFSLLREAERCLSSRQAQRRWWCTAELVEAYWAEGALIGLLPAQCKALEGPGRLAAAGCEACQSCVRAVLAEGRAPQ